MVIPTETTPPNSSLPKTGCGRKRKITFNSREDELQTKLRRCRVELGTTRLRLKEMEDERNRALTVNAQY